MEMTTLKVRGEFISEALGTMPGDEELLKEHILKRARKENPDLPPEMEEETLDSVPKFEDEIERQTTFFYRDKEGNFCMRDYQVKGYFKAACWLLRRVPETASAKVKAFKKLISAGIHVFPRFIKLDIPKDAKADFLERPLRAETPKGDRVCLARSEYVPAGTKFEFEIMTPCVDLLDAIEEWLEYTPFFFYGQWRNAGYGRAKCEILNGKEKTKKK